MSEERKKKFMKGILDFVGDVESEPFAPFAYYNKDGDCVEFFAKSDDYYAERVDGFLTVYRSRDNNEIIGSLMKNIKSIFDQWPGFAVEIHEDKVHLASLFLAGLWSKKPSENLLVEHRIYRSIIKTANEIGVEAELVLN